MGVHFKQVAIVGVGLIGGSMGMAMKQGGLASTVVGIGRRLENLELAVKLGAIDHYEREGKQAVEHSDLVILATPVETYARHLKEWGASLQPETIVSDVGSVKGHLVAQVEQSLPPQVRFVGAHPIAGREKSGVAASSTDLFRGARCIITPTASTNAQALEMVRNLWEAIGSSVVSMDPFVHDWVLGAVSHLPHVVAFTLMNALTEIQQQTKGDVDLLSYSGGGLRDTTRIAASSPEMWRDIFFSNRENLVSMIETFETHLYGFKEALKTHERTQLEAKLEQAKQAREHLS